MFRLSLDLDELSHVAMSQLLNYARMRVFYLIGGSLPKSFSVEQVDTDKISLVVGPGGKTIRGIIESSGVESVDVSDDGSVSLPTWRILLNKIVLGLY